MVHSTPPPVPVDAAKFLDGLITELALPDDIASLKSTVEFSGSEPVLAIPHKSQALTSALQGLLGIAGARLLQLRGNKAPAKISIDTDHATLFLTSMAVGKLDGLTVADPRFEAKLPANNNVAGPHDGLGRQITNVFKTKDGRYFHAHGSLDPQGALKVIGIEAGLDSNLSMEEGQRIIAEQCLKYTASELRDMCISAGIVGDIILREDEFDTSEQGKIIGSLPLARFLPVSETTFPTPHYPALTSPAARPLEGVRVLECTRVIAGSVAGRLLAELGAQVVRIIGPDLPDISILQVDYNMDKRSTHIDLKTDKGQAQLDHLLQTADVFLQGYRPEALARRGLHHQRLDAIAKSRGKPFVIVDESCYGGELEGAPWSKRPGYQQIADTLTGVSYQTGEAYGLKDEPVVPCLPISDYCTGILCAAQAVLGLIQNAKAASNTAKTIASPVALSAVDLYLRKQEHYPSDWVRSRYEALPEDSRYRFDSGFFNMLLTTLNPGGLLAKAKPEFFQEVEARGFVGKHARSAEAQDPAARGTYIALGPVVRFEGIDSRYKTTAPWGYYRPGWDEADADDLERKVAKLA